MRFSFLANGQLPANSLDPVRWLVYTYAHAAMGDYGSGRVV